MEKYQSRVTLTTRPTTALFLLSWLLTEVPRLFPTPPQSPLTWSTRTTTPRCLHRLSSTPRWPTQVSAAAPLPPWPAPMPTPGSTRRLSATSPPTATARCSLSTVLRVSYQKRKERKQEFMIWVQLLPSFFPSFFLFFFFHFPVFFCFFFSSSSNQRKIEVRCSQDLLQDTYLLNPTKSFLVIKEKKNFYKTDSQTWLHWGILQRKINYWKISQNLLKL